MIRYDNLFRVEELTSNMTFKDEQPSIEGVVKPLIHIKQAVPDNAINVVQFFTKHSEVSFCDWQNDDETRHILEKDTTVVFLAYAGTQIVGACFCGILGSRATVNHLAVDAEYRKNRIAGKLVTASFEAIKARGIKRIFLFVDDDNDRGIHFWKNQGFTETNAEITLERDI
jgi:ribosomal protein S18 acetylase RimI-like enzyme